MPRAAMSVATSVLTSPLRNAASTRSRWPCDLLPWIASAAMPARTRLRTTLSAPCLVLVKTSARSIVSWRNTSIRIADLAARSTRMTRCSTFSTVVATGTTATLAGSRSICAARSAIALRHGRGKHQRLPLSRQLGDDFADVLDEAHVEHAIGFVEHEKLDVAKAQRIALHEIEQPARRGDEDIDAVEQRANLRAHRHAADGQRRPQMQVAPIGAEAVEDLAGQFARRAEHQDAAALAHRRTWLGGELVQDRQREGRGLAGTGLGDADDVAARHHGRDGLGLDRSWREVLFLGEGTYD